MNVRKDLIVLNIFVLTLVAYVLTSNSVLLTAACLIAVYIYIETTKIKRTLDFKEAEIENLKKRMTLQREYFTETLVHDLKVPTIAQLRGLELLQHETIGTVSCEQKELIVQIKQSCKYVLDMITTVINTYKLEGGDDNIVYEEFNISNLLTECFDEISYIAKDKNLTFACVSPQNNILLEAGRAEIKKVMLTLLSNAATYSDENERIPVNITADNDLLKFAVSCKGIALTKEECREMFNFVRNNESRFSIIGQGIEMYLSKKIIDIHNGQIFVNTDGENSNTFTFIIPRYKSKTKIKDTASMCI